MPHLQTLYRAVWEEHGLRLTVRVGPPIDGPVTFEVAPYGLVAKASAWYLVGAREDRVRAYAVADVIAAEENATPVLRPPDFDLERFWQGWCGEIERDRPTLTVRARIAPSLMPRLAWYLGRETAASVKLSTEPFATGDAAVRYCQQETAAAGGIDVLVNLIAISRAEARACSGMNDVEDLVSAKLLGPTLMSRVAANRMRLTLGTGLVLKVVRMATLETDAEMAVAGIVRTALAAMTRSEAQHWADQAIRINAVGPSNVMGGILGGSCGACLTSEPDIAALALYLASRKGRQLSGHVFDAEGVAGRGC